VISHVLVELFGKVAGCRELGAGAKIRVGPDGDFPGDSPWSLLRHARFVIAVI
jgi:hypothetical protein